MRQILLLIAPLFLAACSVQNTFDKRDPLAAEKFIDGYLQSITLNQISGSAATVDQVKKIAHTYVYDGANERFVNAQIIGYKVSLQDGTDERGFRTITMNAPNGSAKFIFNKKDRVRDTVALGAPATPRFRIIEGH